MSKSLGTLTLDLVAKTAGFVQGMSKAERESAKWRKSVKKDADEAGKKAKASLATIAASAIASGTALAAMVVQTAQSAREIQNLSAIANTNSQEFQRASYGASLFGIEQDKLADILKDTQDKIGDFTQNGAGPLADFFDNIAPKVGVTADEFKNLSGKDALQLYVSSLEKANLSQSEMTFYMEAIASDATALLPLLRDNGKLMDEYGDKAEKAGLVLSEMDFMALEGAQKTIDEISANMTGFSNILTTEAAPALEGIGNLFLDLITDAGGAKEAARSFVDGVVDGAGFAADAVEGVRRTFDTAGKFIAVFGLSATDVMLTLAQTIIDAPTAAANGLITVLNSIPLLDLNIEAFGQGELSRDIENQIQLIRGAVDVGMDDIHQTLMEPWPSDSIKKYVDDAKNNLDEIPPTLAEAWSTDSVEKYTDETKKNLDEIPQKIKENNAVVIDEQQGFWEQWLEGARISLEDFQSLSASVIDTFSSSFGDAFESVLLDSENVNDALRGIAETILRNVVNAIGQMIAQWLAAQAVQAALGTTATATTVAQAGVAGAAWATPAALASLATAGANSAPAAAALTTTTTLANTLALTGMAHDGIDSVPQTGTWLLEKGERVMTKDTSAKLDKKLDSMGGESIVNIYNAPAGTRTETTTDEFGRAVTNVILEDVASGGQIIRGINQATGTTRVGQ